MVDSITFVYLHATKERANASEVFGRGLVKVLGQIQRQLEYKAGIAWVCRNRALRGVLFWRWDLNVYEGMPPADYGLLAIDTTFDIVQKNADQVKSLMVSIPPAPSCKLGCWVPVTEQVSSKRSVNKCAPFFSVLSQGWQWAEVGILQEYILACKRESGEHRS